MMAENLIYTEGGCHHFSESKKLMTMKNRTCLSLVFTFFFLNTLCLKAYSWENTKEIETLRYRIDVKINALQKEKAQQSVKLEAPNAHLSDKQRDRIAVAIKDLDSRLAELNTSKMDIERLSNDKKYLYTFSQTGDNSVIRKTNNVIIIQGANDALLIHEIRHISLWLQSGRAFQFSKNKLLMPIFGDGSVDELQAYRAQYAFEPNSLPGVFPTDMAHVNIEYIAKIQKADGSIAYPSIRQMWQDDLRISQQRAKLKQSRQGIYSARSNQ
jgi:low affinity Fe/Cu permease